jgi:hypothetical protein
VIAAAAFAYLAPDVYALAGQLATHLSLQEKVEIYSETQTSQGTGGVLYSIVLIINIIYIYKQLDDFEGCERDLALYSISLLALSVLAIFIFPGTYALYSRAYVLGSILQGLAISKIWQTRRTAVAWLYLIVTASLALFSYARLVSQYADEYTPYKTFLGL